MGQCCGCLRRFGTNDFFDEDSYEQYISDEDDGPEGSWRNTSPLLPGGSDHLSTGLKSNGGTKLTSQQKQDFIRGRSTQSGKFKPQRFSDPISRSGSYIKPKSTRSTLRTSFLTKNSEGRSSAPAAGARTSKLRSSRYSKFGPTANSNSSKGSMWSWGSSGSSARSSKALSNQTCAVCAKTVYATEMEKQKDAVFHRACYKCAECRQPINGLQYEMDNSQMYCDGAAPRNCYRRMLEQRRGHTSSSAVQGTEAGTKEVAVGGEMGVAEIQEAIGAELEAAIDGLLPRCDTCGGTFQATDKLMMLGMAKWHNECYLTKKPMRERDMTAAQAVRFLPLQLVLRVGVNGKTLTYFFVPRGGEEGVEALIKEGRRAKAGDALKLEFIPDPAARASPCRPVGPAVPDPVFTLEGGGGSGGVGAGEFGSVSSAGPCSASPDSSLNLGATGSLVASLVHHKYSLQHTMSVEFRYAESGGANGAATLTAQEASISILVP